MNEKQKLKKIENLSSLKLCTRQCLPSLLTQIPLSKFPPSSKSR